MALVAGVDSSTQSCKVVVRNTATGVLVREGRATHPDGTEIDPAHWWDALQQAVAAAGGLDDVAAVGIGAQQHGMVALDEAGEVVRPALLWNDTRSAAAAAALVDERGATAWADEIGVVPVAAITVSKLRWLAEHEPAHAARTAAVCLPHDWLMWRLTGADGLDALRTDRGDASGTGYWSAARNTYRPDVLHDAFGRDLVLPTVLGPAELAGQTVDGVVVSAGSGDNAAAALGLGAQPGDVIVSIGTSGVVSAVSTVAAADPTGTVAGFADATGHFLPLVCTLNAARVLDATATLLGVDHQALSNLALSAPPGAGGVVLIPWFEGERTPNRPDATAQLQGLTLDTTTPAHVARAAVEGLLCGLADGLDALRAHGASVDRVLLVGGGAASEAVRRIAPSVLGAPVIVPPSSEYVADGAARQAAWALSGLAEPPPWVIGEAQRFDADPLPEVRVRYAEVRDRGPQRH